MKVRKGREVPSCRGVCPDPGWMVAAGGGGGVSGALSKSKVGWAVGGRGRILELLCLWESHREASNSV